MAYSFNQVLDTFALGDLSATVTRTVWAGPVCECGEDHFLDSSEYRVRATPCPAPVKRHGVEYRVGFSGASGTFSTSKASRAEAWAILRGFERVG